MDFSDPLFLQSLGRVTVSFALLEGGLLIIPSLESLLEPMPEAERLVRLKQVKRMNYSDKVKDFVKLANRALNHGVTDRSSLTSGLKAELNDVAKHRNRYIHDFWTFSVERQAILLKNVEGEGMPDLFPTPEDLSSLADRIYAVRERIASVVIGCAYAVREHNIAKAEQG
jgi:hypothetical protein